MSMISPATGRITSEYGRRAPIPGVTSGTFHAGIDIANKTGTPIYAAYAGTVVAAGWATEPGRSGDRVRIKNPDGEQQYYGHVSKIHVKVGQKVAAGQHIADMGATGNVTGPHLHFETWSASGKTRNPRIDFQHWHLAPGSAPKITTPARPPAKGKDKIRAYQRRQNIYGNAGLLEDGINGPVTKAWKRWTKKLQKALRPWRGIPGNLRADGDYARITHTAVRTLQTRNGLFVDGYADSKTLEFMRRYGSNVPNRP